MHDDKFTKGMRGEFKGDFTRDTFDPLRHFSRVLMQQGRVQLDADWNEQVSIFYHYMRTVVADLVGPHGVPAKPDGTNLASFKGDGFKIEAEEKTFHILHGHYYVNGILCENDFYEYEYENGLPYEDQPNCPLTEEEKSPLEAGNYLVYLDVWERHLSYVEDDYMREKALGGPDTATRARIVWQVKVKNYNDFEGINSDEFNKNYEIFLEALTIANEKKPGSGLLKARARKTAEDNKDPCLTSPEASYRGAENQLYRVEIHKNSAAEGGPTFKWSRENGSVIFPITEISGKKVTLEHLGRDNRFGLKPNDWVEIIDDDYVLRNRAGTLQQIEEIDPENLQVTLKNRPDSLVGTDKDKHPYLRRWDQKDGDSNGVPVKEGDKEQDWILLEDGVEIQFPTPREDINEIPHMYQAGDYWLIPARAATGDVEWPGPEDAPEALTPQGVDHHYAPLAKIEINGNGKVTVELDLRRKLNKIWV